MYSKHPNECITVFACGVNNSSVLLKMYCYSNSEHSPFQAYSFARRIALDVSILYIFIPYFIQILHIHIFYCLLLLLDRKIIIKPDVVS